jgi:hypothetical protein
MTTTTINIDNTKRRCYALCPRKFYFEHVKNLRPLYGSTALRFGLCWHETLEAYYTTILKEGWEAKTSAITNGALAAKASWEKESKDRQFYSDYRTLENCLSAFMGYITYYSDDESFLEVVDVEETFKIPVSDEVFFTGKIDAKVKLNGSKWLLEHKTTSMPIDRQLKTLQRDAQIIGYTFAGMQDHEIEGTLISMTHVSSIKSKTTGTYGKTKIEYRRSPQIFTQGDIESWLESLLWTGEQIISSTKNNFWPCQLDSCYHFGSCTYTQLCEQNCKNLEEVNTQNYITVPNWNVLET